MLYLLCSSTSGQKKDGAFYVNEWYLNYTKSSRAYFFYVSGTLVSGSTR